MVTQHRPAGLELCGCATSPESARAAWVLNQRATRPFQQISARGRVLCASWQLRRRVPFGSLGPARAHRPLFLGHGVRVMYCECAGAGRQKACREKGAARAARPEGTHTKIVFAVSTIF